MLDKEGLSVVQLIEGDIDLEVFLRKSHVLIHLGPKRKTLVRVRKGKRGTQDETYLEGIIKVSNITERIQELVHSSLVVVDEGVESHHVSFLCVRRLVGQILQHLRNLLSPRKLRLEKWLRKSWESTTDQSQSPSRVLCARWETVDEHVGLGSDDCWVDKTKEEETSDEGTNRVIGCFRVFSLFNKNGIS